MLTDIFGNRIIWTALIAWATAQILKVLLTLGIQHTFDRSRFLGAGGMPSSHSACVCAMATVVGLREGFGSSIFAVALLFAVVVMYDAAGVRRESGKNAEVINHIVESLSSNGWELEEEPLKELIGHTPFQVAAGALLGVIIGCIAAL